MHHNLERDIEGMLRRWVGVVDRRAGFILLLVLALAVVGAVHAARTLSIDTDSSRMIDSDVPFRINALRMQELFPETHNQMLVVIRAPTPDEADFVAAELSARLHRDERHFRDVFASSVDPFFQRQGLLFLDLDDLIDLTSRLSSAAPLLEELVADPTLPRFFAELSRTAEASEEGVELAVVAGAFDEVARTVESVTAGTPKPLSWEGLFGQEEEGPHQRVIVVHPVLDFGSLQPARRAVEALRAAVAALPPELVAGVDVALTGDPILRMDELKSVSDGIEVSGIVSLVLVSLLLAFGLRSWQLVFVSLAALIVALALTAGFAAIAIGTLNLVSIAFTVLLIGLGIDFAIHLLLHYRERVARGGEHLAALGGAVGTVGPALALAAMTTAVAFLSFVPTDFVGMAQLGVISGVGVLIACGVSLTLIPALLHVLPRTRCRPAAVRFTGAFGGLIERYAIWVGGAALLLGAGAAALLPQVRFDADPMSLRDPESPSAIAFNLLFDRVQDTPYRLNYIGEDLGDALEFAARAERLDLVEAALTLDDFVPGNQEDKLLEIDFLLGDLAFVLTGAEELASRPPDTRPTDRAAAAAAAADLIAATERIVEQEAGSEQGMAAARLGDALRAFTARAAEEPALYDLLDAHAMRFFPMQMERLQLQLTARPVTIADLPPDIRRRFVAPSGEVRVEVVPVEDVRDPDRRAAFVEAVATISPDLSGGAFSVLRGGEVVSAAMIQATLTAFGLSTLLILVMTRNFAFVLVVTLPLALAAVLTAATGVLVNLPFNYANVIVLPLLIGLGVDSALHLVMRTRRIHRPGALFATSTPRAVFLSALTTIASFGSLALSDHRGTASMGELLMIAIALTLVSTLVILPCLVALAGRRLENVEDDP